MQDIPGTRSLLERWEDYRPSKTQMFWVAVGAIVVTLVIGFGPAGWVTAGKARQMVGEAAGNARHELATAVCVEDFLRDADAGARLKQVKQAVWYERDRLVADGGWATMPDRKEPNSLVASMCSAQLARLDESRLRATSAKTVAQ
jgi:hypothetical protein